MGLFDSYIVVDWSASATPKTGRDSIWSSVVDAHGGEPVVINHRTRRAALADLTMVLAASRRRVLVGFDFPYGYPAGFAHAAGVHGRRPWAATWEHIAREVRDGVDNANNRFEVASALNERIGGVGVGPFWGTTSDRQTTPSLSRTKAPGFPHGQLSEFRHSEQSIRATGKRPFAVWQLTGAGSVGSQALMGIPVLLALRSHAHLVRRSVVWPFETGLTTDPGSGRADAIVHAEIWPSGIDVDVGRHPVKDAAQVICLSEHLARLDAAGELATLFAPALDPATAEVVVAEEGWILGAH